MTIFVSCSHCMVMSWDVMCTCQQKAVTIHSCFWAEWQWKMSVPVSRCSAKVSLWHLKWVDFEFRTSTIKAHPKRLLGLIQFPPPPPNFPSPASINWPLPKLGIEPWGLVNYMVTSVKLALAACRSHVHFQSWVLVNYMEHTEAM